MEKSGRQRFEDATSGAKITLGKGSLSRVRKYNMEGDKNGESQTCAQVRS